MRADHQLGVGTLMRTRVVAVDRGATLRGAARALHEASVGTAVIMDGAEVTGILSERDVVRALAGGADPDHAEVGTAMTVQPRYATPGDSLNTAMDTMLAAGIRHLPVLDDGELVGIVSIRDLAEGLTAVDRRP
jgi:CBS domain-containing protein